MDEAKVQRVQTYELGNMVKLVGDTVHANFISVASYNFKV